MCLRERPHPARTSGLEGTFVLCAAEVKCRFNINVHEGDGPVAAQVLEGQRPFVSQRTGQLFSAVEICLEALEPSERDARSRGLNERGNKRTVVRARIFEYLLCQANGFDRIATCPGVEGELGL